MGLRQTGIVTKDGKLLLPAGCNRLFFDWRTISSKHLTWFFITIQIHTSVYLLKWSMDMNTAK